MTNQEKPRSADARPARKGRTGPAARAGQSRDWVLWLLAVLALTFAVYTPTLDNQFTNWDDPSYVTNNPLLEYPDPWRIITTPVIGNFHPLTIYSLVLNYKLSGLNPASYHWLSLLLHLANTALTFLFVRRLTGGAKWPAAICAVFFGVHPLHVESVAWIAERKDVLYGFFYLAGLLTYLEYLDTKRRNWLWYTLAAFALSLASKPSAVVFPVTLLALDWYRGRSLRADGWKAVVEKLPFVAGSLFVAYVTVNAQVQAGALANASAFGPLQRVLLAAYGTAMYVVKFFLPFNLSVIYPVSAVSGLQYAIGVAVLLGLVALYVLRNDRDVRFGLLFFAINIALSAQLFTFGRALMADRYTYLPYIGLLFTLAVGLAGEGRSARAGATADGGGAGGGMGRTLVQGVLAILLPLCLLQTWQRGNVWQNSETLWNDVIQRYPKTIFDAYNFRGYYYEHDVGRLDAAMADYNQALALSPTAARVWYNRGSLWERMGRVDSALVSFNRAIALKPDLVDAYNSRGAIRGRIGDLPGAVEDFSRAIQIDPRFRGALVNRSIAYYMLRQHLPAIIDARRAISLEPDNPENASLLDATGLNLQALDRPQEALAEHDRAIASVATDDPRLGGFFMNRSLAWRAMGQMARARNDALEAERRGVALDPKYMATLAETPDSTRAPQPSAK